MADGGGCQCYPLPDQTCPLQSLQKTKTNTVLPRLFRLAGAALLFGFSASTTRDSWISDWSNCVDTRFNAPVSTGFKDESYKAQKG
jgi:hypothetical protein